MTRALWTAAVALVVALATAGSAPAQQTTTSPHGALAVECAACHQPASWTAIRTTPEFDHASSGFPLRGGHARAACRACHVSLDFAGTSRECVACHEDLHRGELGSACARCHTPRSFFDRTAMVQEHAQTRFPLDGSHLLADCRACHAGVALGRLTFVGQPSRCEACHMTRYASATPDHQQVGFSTDCTQCHSTIDWARARFDHSQAGFPLTGAHAGLSCDQCHRNFTFTGSSAACVDCHQRDYDATSDPNHATAGLPTDCAACHGTTSWEGAHFDHNQTGFSLTGAHATLTCAQCHQSGSFSGGTVACVDCHQQDYDGTTNPSHVAAGIPTDCVACHGTVTWDGARFDHDATWFPIYSGRHRGRWNSCSDCHTVADNFAQFTCTQCHSQARMDEHHRGVAGYGPTPSDCLRCHPQGNAP